MRPSRIGLLLASVLVASCSSTQVWHLNAKIPHRSDQPGRAHFDERMTKLFRLYGVESPADWYVVNEDLLVFRVPPGSRCEFESRIRAVACDPVLDPKDCYRLHLGGGRPNLSQAAK